jgi:hypothetical protein
MRVLPIAAVLAALSLPARSECFHLRALSGPCILDHIRPGGCGCQATSAKNVGTPKIQATSRRRRFKRGGFKILRAETEPDRSEWSDKTGEQGSKGVNGRSTQRNGPIRVSRDLASPAAWADLDLDLGQAHGSRCGVARNLREAGASLRVTRLWAPHTRGGKSAKRRWPSRTASRLSRAMTL